TTYRRWCGGSGRVFLLFSAGDRRGRPPPGAAPLAGERLYRNDIGGLRRVIQAIVHAGFRFSLVEKASPWVGAERRLRAALFRLNRQVRARFWFLLEHLCGDLAHSGE